MKGLEVSRAAEIRRLHEEIGVNLRTTLDKAIRVGELLTEQKASMAHGKWLPWLADNCPFSARLGEDYMRFYEHRVDLKSATIADFASARKLLTASRDTGLSPIERAVQRHKDAFRAAQDAAEAAVHAEAEIGKHYNNFDRRDECLKRIDLLRTKGEAISAAAPGEDATAEGVAQWFDDVLALSEEYTAVFSDIYALRETFPELEQFEPLTHPRAELSEEALFAYCEANAPEFWEILKKYRAES